MNFAYRLDAKEAAPPKSPSGKERERLACLTGPIFKASAQAKFMGCMPEKKAPEQKKITICFN